jgi:hypothetical protein
MTFHRISNCLYNDINHKIQMNLKKKETNKQIKLEHEPEKSDVCMNYGTDINGGINNPYPSDTVTSFYLSNVI